MPRIFPKQKLKREEGRRALLVFSDGEDNSSSHDLMRTFFRQIAEELRTSYELAYYPTNSDKDETFRKIVIGPKRAEIKVRTKTGYFSIGPCLEAQPANSSS